MGRKPCCAKEGMNRGAWSAMEDEVLANYVKIHGQGKWRHLSQKAGLQRCGKSCRLRWMNYLRPDIKRGNISAEEEELIVRLHKLLGNRWSLIAGRLPGRTDNEIKNYWNTNLTKRVQGHKNSTSKATKPNYSDLQLNKLGKLQEDTDEHRVIQNKAEKCTNTLGVKSYMDENTSGREEESESPSSSALQFEENLTDFDFNELLAPDASILTFHGIEQVDGNDKDVAGNVGYGHGFSLYMDDFELFSSINEAKPSYEVAAVDHFITTETMDVRSLETYLDLEDVWIN